MQCAPTQISSKKKLRCVVANCENRGRHQFPKDEVRRRQWIEAIKHVKPGTTISAYSLICSDHFQITDFSVIPSYWNNYYPGRNLRRTVVPSVFPWNKTSVEVRLEQPSSSVQVKEQPSSSVQDTLSFNPEQVKAAYSRARPTVFAKEQKSTVSTVTVVTVETISKKKLWCVVDNCGNEGRHKFPKNEVRRRRWIEAIKHLKLRTTISAHSLICSDHFRISVFPWNKTSVEVKLEPTSSDIRDEFEKPSSYIQDELRQASSYIKVKLEELSPPIQPLSPIQVKLEKPSSPIQDEFEQPSTSVQYKLPPIQDELVQPSSAIQVKLEKPSSPIQDEFEQPSTSVQDKLPPIQDELVQPSSAIQVKLERPSSPIQDELEQPSTFELSSSSVQIKQEKPSSPIQDEVKQPLSSIQVKLEKPSSPIQDEFEQTPTSVQVKLEKPSSCIEVELEPLSSSSQDTLSLKPNQVTANNWSSFKPNQVTANNCSNFKPNHVKSRKFKNVPAKLIMDQYYKLSMAIDKPHKMSKKDLKLKIAKMCRCIVDNCPNKGRHQLPKNEARRRQWMEAIKHVKPGMTITARSVICSDHFLTTDFSIPPINNYCSSILRRNVVPSVFPWNKTSVEVNLKQSSQETPSFNPNQVKATYSRALPRVFLPDQNYMALTATADPREDPLQLSNSISDLDNVI